jgi:hypothetical protein
MSSYSHTNSEKIEKKRRVVKLWEVQKLFLYNNNEINWLTNEPLHMGNKYVMCYSVVNVGPSGLVIVVGEEVRSKT